MRLNVFPGTKITRKNVINVAVLERGSMLHIFIDNYFDGELEFRNRIPGDQ